MLISLVRYCYGSSPIKREESSPSTAIDRYMLATATINQSVYSQAQIYPQRRRIYGGARPWRPVLCAILEDATTVFAEEIDRPRIINIPVEKSVISETTSFPHKLKTPKERRKPIKFHVSSPGFAASAFMY